MKSKLLVEISVSGVGATAIGLNNSGGKDDPNPIASPVVRGIIGVDATNIVGRRGARQRHWATCRDRMLR
ncbi:MAG: hypothetical protein KDJ65_27495 [Anaerolineae bacterium]|nr:hypothetical protein [Anaerolineae bacterium]